MSRLKPSRQFEKLVAKVERTLAGQNAVITSPERIQDKDVPTPHLREIDVSICMKGERAWPDGVVKEFSDRWSSTAVEHRKCDGDILLPTAGVLT